MSNRYKYIGITLVLIFLLTGHTKPIQALAQPDKVPEDKVCVNVCPKEPVKLSNAFSRGFCYVSGLNFLAAKVAENAVEKQLKKNANGSFDVDIEPFSAFDLIAGKLKSLEVDAKNVEIEQVYMSSIHAKSICDYIHIDYKAKPVKIIEPLTIGFDSVITQNDLSRTVSSPKYLEKISSVKINGEKFRWANLINPRATIRNGRIIIYSDLQFAGMPKGMGVPVVINSSLGIVNNKVQMSDIKISTAGINVNLTLSDYMLDKINPVFGSIKDLEVKGRKINISKVAVKNNQIHIKGSIWLPKSIEANTISNK